MNTIIPSPTVIDQSFSLSFDYPVIFSRDILNPENPVIDDVLHRRESNRRQRAAVFIDAGVVGSTPGILERITAYFKSRSTTLELAAPPHITIGGPAAKNGWEPVRAVMTTLGDLHMDRQSFVIAIGGGSMLDMVGFAASIVHRGLRLVRAPTTTLSQNDSGVGVKNGMDEHGQKNFVGTFAPPFGVINDSDFLQTLTLTDWIGGISEAVKIAAIKDAALLDDIAAHGPAIRRRGSAGTAALERIIHRCAVAHLEHIRTSGDPFEFGSARPLDFGHWAGHKIETMTGHAVPHGQAVAIGIAIDTCYAHQAGYLSAADTDKILQALTACGLPVFHPCLLEKNSEGKRVVLGGLQDFREHLGGALCVTLPGPLGAKTEVNTMDEAMIEKAILHLARLSP
ncbi:MAG: 3-dehydroquinate synthase [Lentisphaeria bacterium]|nr:3-dehydroquinate synthase [Lentisphaeria bacterium]